MILQYLKEGISPSFFVELKHVGMVAKK